MGRERRFGPALQLLLEERSVSQADLARAIGTSRAYVSALANSQKAASPQRIEAIADLLETTREERIRLHRAAALDQGFNLDLPDDF